MSRFGDEPCPKASVQHLIIVIVQSGLRETPVVHDLIFRVTGAFNMETDLPTRSLQVKLVKYTMQF
jgi:hypothetical protein